MISTCKGLAVLAVLLGLNLGLKNNEVWLDNKCQRSEQTCQVLGLEFVQQSKYGDSWLPCLKGYRVKCKIPDEYFEEVTEDDSEEKYQVDVDSVSLNIVSFNLEEFNYLPGEIKGRSGNGTASDIAYDGHIEKSCRILFYVLKHHKNADIISIIDAQIAGCVAGLTFKDFFTQNGWPYSYIAHEQGFMGLGTQVFSKVPVSLIEGRFFEEQSHPDVKSEGFLNFLLEKDEKKFVFSVIKQIISLTKQQWEAYETLSKVGHPVIVNRNYRLGLKKNGNNDLYYLGFREKPEYESLTEYDIELKQDSEYCSNMTNFLDWKKLFDKTCETMQTYSVLLESKLLDAQFVYHKFV